MTLWDPAALKRSSAGRTGLITPGLLFLVSALLEALLSASLLTLYYPTSPFQNSPMTASPPVLGYMHNTPVGLCLCSGHVSELSLFSQLHYELFGAKDSDPKLFVDLFDSINELSN